MRDVKVIRPKTVLRVSSVAPIRGFYPPAVAILGERFNYADEVLYNGVDVGEFLIASTSRIIARVPDQFVDKTFVEVQVLSSSPSVQENVLISMGMTRPVRTVSGIDRLVQEWLLTFYTTPGSDIFRQDSGGGGRSVIGQVVTDTAGSSAMASLSLAVDRTKQELLRRQAQQPTTPPAERLLSTSLSELFYDPQTTSLRATVSISNMLGAVAQVPIR